MMMMMTIITVVVVFRIRDQRKRGRRQATCLCFRCLSSLFHAHMLCSLLLPYALPQVEAWLLRSSFELGESMTLADLRDLNDKLKASTFLAGNELTLADIIVYSAVAKPIAALAIEDRSKTLCNIARWFLLIQVRARERERECGGPHDADGIRLCRLAVRTEPRRQAGIWAVSAAVHQARAGCDLARSAQAS